MLINARNIQIVYTCPLKHRANTNKYCEGKEHHACSPKLWINCSRGI